MTPSRELSMPTAEYTMSVPMERSHDVQSSVNGPPDARLWGTLVLLFAIGTAVVACGLMTVLFLHPLSPSKVARPMVAIVAE